MLSIVTTLYQSAAYVAEFHRRASDAARRITDDYEIVMVDDGSPDESLSLALGLVATDPRVRVIELSKNFGHHKAMMTGLEHARGECVFLLDADLEEDPAWLDRFWAERIATGADVVYGYQEVRKGRFVERVGGAILWWMIRHLVQDPIPANLVTARLMTRQFVRSLVQHKEQRTAIGGLWTITGYRQRGLAVKKVHRDGSSYSFGHRLAAAFDGITAFSERPLILVFWLGSVLFFIALAGGLYLVGRRVFGGPLLSGWASVIVSVWMLGGLAIAAIGVVGLYTARIFIETKHRPYVIIREIHQTVSELPPS